MVNSLRGSDMENSWEGHIIKDILSQSNSFEYFFRSCRWAMQCGSTRLSPTSETIFFLSNLVGVCSNRYNVFCIRWFSLFLINMSASIHFSKKKKKKSLYHLIFETFRMTQLLMNKSRIPSHVISLNLFIISFSTKLINSDVIYNHLLIH